MRNSSVIDGDASTDHSRSRGSFDDGFLRAAPSEVGIDADQVVNFLDQVQRAGLDLHSFMLHRQGRVVAEGWRWPYRPDRLRVLHSVAKSFTACAIGLAIEEGLLSLDEKVVKFFPEEVPADASQWLQAMTVEDLLTMRCGHASEVSGAVWRNISTSWIAEFFKIPLIYAPGTRYVYTSAASYMLSAIITRLTGLSMHEYLKPRLFEPLGIRDERWDIGPDGVNPGGNGLTARTADLLKLGVLHAQGGVWAGRRILPEHWVRLATRAHGELDSTYGYHWQIRPTGAYSAIGVFVQCATVFPEQGVTLAVTGAMEKSAVLFPFLLDHLKPAFLSSVTRNPAADQRLAERIRAWESPPAQQRAGQSALQPWVSGRRYAIDANVAGVQSVKLTFGQDDCTFELRDATGVHVVQAGLGRWIESTTDMPGQDLHHGYTFRDEPVVALARWVDAIVLELTWIFPQTAFRDTVRCLFDGNRLTVQRSVNVNSRLRRHPDLAGAASD